MRSFADRIRRAAAILVLTATAAVAVLAAQDKPAAMLFDEARALEQTLRKDIADYRPPADPMPLVRRARILMSTYEDLERLFPDSGHGDKALWQGALLAADVFDIFKDPGDRAAAVRLAGLLQSKYASSPLVAQAQRRMRALPAADAPRPATAPAPRTQSALRPAARPAAPASGPTTLRAIRREVLPDVLRVTLDLDREVTFHDERIDGPPRVFVDLPNTRAAASVQDARIAFRDDVVRAIRVGRQLDRRIRVVLDLGNAPAHSVYTLYNPFRIVIDFERPRDVPAPSTEAGAAVQAARAEGSGSAVPAVADDPGLIAAKLVVAPSARPPLVAASAPAAPLPTPAAVPAAAAPPAAPKAAVNLDQPISVPPSLAARPGGLSMSRQLGLGIGRIVIDPGHGGHDPGAKEFGVTESELVLDIAFRLEQLLQKDGEFEVVLTRRSNVYVPLEDRPAMAAREQADLYLSIHANASADPRARGVETYILNFAPNARSEAVAARENRGSVRTMKNLPDIVRAIALNNKIEESRALARQVQTSLVEKLSRPNRVVRNLGVKQAPFAVLVGADMPSILAEIAFITNRQEATLVKTAVYRQQIAEALADGIRKYQRRLKPSQVTAASE